MSTNIISETKVKEILNNILLEEMSKISRQEFTRTQFKVDELYNSLNETIKDFRKLQDTIPSELKTTTNKKLTTISSYLYSAQRDISQLKESLKGYKRKMFNQQIDEKKTK